MAAINPSYLEKLRDYRSKLRSDLLAGATGAVAGAPQAMGFAIVAGISPLYGLYAAFIATIVGALFSNSTMMTIAPTNAIAVVVGSSLLGFGPDNQLAYLFIITLFVGLFQILFGVLRLGSLTQFVSEAVMTGFITGAGLLIMLGQLDHLTGYETHATAVLPAFWEWFVHLPQSEWQAVLVGVAATIMIYFLHHTRFKSIATLVAMVVTSFFVALVGWENVPLVRDLAAIPSALPTFAVPDLMLAPQVLSAAFALALLASVQSAALVNSIEEPDGRASDDNRDLIGQGLANVSASFFQGMPSGGSLSRTAVNISSGAETRMANIFAGAFVGVTLLFFGNVIERITLAALAGHLIVAALSLINVSRLRMIWRASWSARLTLSVTLLSTLLAPLEYSIYLGVALSFLLYVYTSAAWIQVVRLEPIGDNLFREMPLPKTLPARQVIVFSVYGNLFFAAVRKLEYLLPPPETSDQTVVILRLRNNPYLGIVGIRFLEKWAQKLDASGSKLIIAGVSEKVEEQLERTGALKAFPNTTFFFSEDVVFSATFRALDYAEDWLAANTTS